MSAEVRLVKSEIGFVYSMPNPFDKKVDVKCGDLIYTIVNSPSLIHEKELSERMEVLDVFQVQRVEYKNKFYKWFRKLWFIKEPISFIKIVHIK